MKLLRYIRIILYIIKSYIIILFGNKIVDIKNQTNANALILTPFRREEKLDLILNEINIGTIHLNFEFQKKIHGIFFSRYELRYYEHINKISLQKFRVFFYKIFVTNLIKYLKKKYKIKFIINFAIHYKSEFLFDDISTKLNLKFFTFHRECLYASKNTREFIKSKLINAPKFRGHKLIVHNEIAKKIFCESNFCNKDKIEIIGPLRVDENLKFKNQINISSKNKTILFYIFGTGAMIMRNEDYGSDWISNKGWVNLLDNTYKTLVTLADKFKNCEFIFKAKYNSQDFLLYHNEKVKNFNGSNIKFYSEEKNFSLLKKSDLIISYNSTTIVEAALFDKNILIPFFDEVQNQEYSEFVGFKELDESKVVCKSKNDFIKKISNIIENNDQYLLNNFERSKLLKNYIGETDGNNHKRVKNLFLKEL